MLRCLRESGGGVLALPDEELFETQKVVGRLGAGYLSLETAAAVAAVPRLLAVGAIAKGDEVVVFDTGAGFKNDIAPGYTPAPAVENDAGVWGDVVAKLRKS
jgi:threonine synthase